MNLDDIALFIQVVEQGSFTKAADLNDLPKSTISRRIRNLEDSLQCRLLERTTRKLTLTDVGQEFLHRAYEITTHIEETQRQISRSQDDYTATLPCTGQSIYSEWEHAISIISFSITTTYRSRSTRLCHL